MSRSISSASSSFSALQRAENSSNIEVEGDILGACCFSALQRAENSSNLRSGFLYQLSFESFSALQRAENSSNCARRVRFAAQQPEFQCSSASRKFLKTGADRRTSLRIRVSVLFSEPKIPQTRVSTHPGDETLRFSALQRAENFSTLKGLVWRQQARGVSVLFSEPKISQRSRTRVSRAE